MTSTKSIRETPADAVAKQGRLVHLGLGVFAPNRTEAEEADAVLAEAGIVCPPPLLGPPPQARK